MFTLKKIDGSKPIAQINGGRYNNKLIRLVTENDKINKAENFESPKTDIINYLDLNKIKKMTKNKNDISLLIEQLYEYDKNKNKKLSGDISELFGEARERKKSALHKEIIINDGQIFPIPRVDGVERLYICGPSESGKTTYVYNYLKKYVKMYPDRKIYIFSLVHDDDDILDELNPTRIPITDKLLNKNILTEHFKNAIVIFDDVDTIRNKKLSNYVHSLRDDLLKTGRHYNISVITTNHFLVGGKETKAMLNESSSITIFPKASLNYRYMLQTYCGFSKEQLKKLKNLPSRWVTIYKRYPLYVVYSSGVYLL